MVIISRSLWPIRDKVSFFASEEEMQRLINELSWNDVLRFRHTHVNLSHHNRLIYKEEMKILYIDLTKDIEQIFREMKKVTRREIRRAEDMLADIEVRVNDNRAKNDFFSVYNSFIKQKGHTHQLSQNRYNDYLNVGDVFVLYFKGKPFAASLDMADYSTQRAYGVFLGSNRLTDHEDVKYSSYLIRYLYWYEIKMYKEKGFKIYDFGGGGEESGSRSWFKQSFGGNIMEEYSYMFAGSLPVCLLGKATMISLKSINKIRSMSK